MGLFDRNVPIKADVLKVSRPWESSVQEGRLEVTPELAERILREANYQGQRKLDTKTVSVYTEMMRRNLWKLSDPISFGRLNNNLTLVNGQHRLHAVIAYGRPVVFRIAVNDCMDEYELRSLFYRFDTVMNVRSPEQVLNAIGLAAEHEVSKLIASATYRAIGIIINNFRIPKAKNVQGEAVVKLRVVDLRIQACDPWWPAAKRLEACMSRGQRDLRKLVLRGSVFAVALMTMKYAPDRAELFWRGVVENDGLKRTDPRNVYVRDLLARNIQDGNADQGIIAASLAWNAWYENRSLSIIKVYDNSVLRIAGTPINGRRSA